MLYASCLISSCSADTLDWDLWLGPAPFRPYHSAYVPFSWRGWLDFGCGALGDMGCHGFDPIVKALKLGQPTSVEASSTPINQETFPSGSKVHYEFPERGGRPGVKLTWYDGGLKPERPEELPARLEMDFGYESMDSNIHWSLKKLFQTCAKQMSLSGAKTFFQVIKDLNQVQN